MPEPVPFRKAGHPPEDSLDSRPDVRENGQELQEERVYTNEEVSEIIRVALRNAGQRDTNTVNHDDMIAIGKDFGLKPEDITRAFDEIGKSRHAEDRIQEAAVAFKFHTLCFGVVNLGLFLINWASMPGYWWSVYPFIGWGMLVLLHGAAVKYAPSLPPLVMEKVVGHLKELRESHPGLYGESTRASFKMSKFYAGFAEVQGLAQIRDDDLLLEFEIRETVFHSFKSKVREIRIPIREIAHARLDRRLWYTKLTLQGHRLRCFDDIPGNSSGEATLIFGREARMASERLAHEIKRRIEQQR